VSSIRGHFRAGLDYQDKLARFLENHDEPRAADTFGPEQGRAAAVITYFSPGLRFFHQGQFEGRMKRISPHLIRAPHEPVNTYLQEFYHDLLAVIKQPIFRNAKWHLLECASAWAGNGSWDSFVAFAWESDERRALVAVNYAPHQSQCYVRLPFADMNNHSVEFRDMLSTDLYIRNGNEIASQGIYLDLPPWGYHVFEVSLLPPVMY
jgi:hypothetical protein